MSSLKEALYYVAGVALAGGMFVSVLHDNHKAKEFKPKSAVEATRPDVYNGVPVNGSSPVPAYTPSPAPETTPAPDYGELANKLEENNNALVREFEKFRAASLIANYGTPKNLIGHRKIDLNDDGIDELAAGNSPNKMRILKNRGDGAYQCCILENVSRISEEKINGYKVIYTESDEYFPDGRRFKVVIRYERSGQGDAPWPSYRQTMRFVDPSMTEQVAESVISAMKSPSPVAKNSLRFLSDKLGQASVLNGLVFAATEPNTPMPTGPDYLRYLKKLNKETGRDFYSIYQHSDPSQLSTVLFNESIEGGLAGNDPILQSIVIGAKAMDKAAQTDSWSRHLKRLDSIGIGGVSQFEHYNGRQMTREDLDKAMRYNVMNENRDYTTRDNMNHSTNDITGQRSTTDWYGRSPEQNNQNSVRDKQKEAVQRQQQGIDQAQKDAQKFLDGVLHPTPAPPKK